MRIIVLIFCVISIVPVDAMAFMVKLKDGRVVNGELMKQTDKGVQLNVRGAAITYFMEEIEVMGEDALKVEENQGKMAGGIKTLAEEYCKLVPSKKLYEDGKAFAATLSGHDIYQKIINNIDMNAFDKIRAEAFAKVFTEDELRFLILESKGLSPKKSIEQKWEKNKTLFKSIRQQALNDAYQKAKQQ